MGRLGVAANGVGSYRYPSSMIVDHVSSTSEATWVRASITALSLALLLAGTAYAETVAYEYEGTVQLILNEGCTHPDPNGFLRAMGISLGTPVRGFFVYETESVDTDSLETVGFYPTALLVSEHTIGQLQLNVPSEIVPSQSFVGVANDVFDEFLGVSLDAIFFQWRSEENNQALNFELVDYSATALSDDSIPVVLERADFEQEVCGWTF